MIAGASCGRCRDLLHYIHILLRRHRRGGDSLRSPWRHQQHETERLHYMAADRGDWCTGPGLVSACDHRRAFPEVLSFCNQLLGSADDDTDTFRRFSGQHSTFFLGRCSQRG